MKEANVATISNLQSSLQNLFQKFLNNVKVVLWLGLITEVEMIRLAIDGLINRFPSELTKHDKISILRVLNQLSYRPINRLIIWCSWFQYFYPKVLNKSSIEAQLIEYLISTQICIFFPFCSSLPNTNKIKIKHMEYNENNN